MEREKWKILITAETAKNAEIKIIILSELSALGGKLFKNVFYAQYKDYHCI